MDLGCGALEEEGSRGGGLGDVRVLGEGARGDWGPSAGGEAHRPYLGAHRPSSNTKVRLVWPAPRTPVRDPLDEPPGLRTPSGSGMRGGSGSDPEPRGKASPLSLKDSTFLSLRS